jgi:hypothetical protein
MYKIGLFLLALSISLILKSSFFQQPLLVQDSGEKQLTTEISDLDNRNSGISGKATNDSENISLETTVSSNFLNIPFLKSENISLEATASSNFLKIPLSPEDNNKSNVEISIRIQNNSRNPQRFTMFNTLGIDIVAPDGKYYFFSELSMFTILPKESECPLIQPGESFVHKLSLSSSRHSVSDEFILGSSNKYGEIWLIKNLEPGEYKLRFTYQNNRRESSLCTSSEVIVFNPLTGVARLKDFWTGFSTTNFVNLTLGF